MKQRILLAALLTFSTDIKSSERQDDIYDPVKLEKLMKELLKLREIIINSFSNVQLLNEEMHETRLFYARFRAKYKMQKDE